MYKIKKIRWIIYLFLAPAFILYSWFLVFPIFNSIKFSFYTGNLFKAEKFVGLANYIKIFTVQPFNERLLNAFFNNLKFFLMFGILQIGVALILAIMLTRKIKGSEIFRTIYFIPSTMSVLTVGFLFSLLLNPVWGVFDNILRTVGLDSLIRPWLGDTSTALPTIAIIAAWQYLGTPLILFTAGISGINTEVIEAAKVDGVSPIGLVKFIIMPLIKPVIGIVLLLTFVANFTRFGLIYAMEGTSGNPSYATDIFGTFFYRTTFGEGAVVFTPDPGLGAAISTIMFIIIFIAVMFWLIGFKGKEKI